MTPLLVLSLRQAVGGRRIWVMLLLVAIPVALAGLLRAFGADISTLHLSDDITNRLLISMVLPLVMLVLATASFGNELDDHTLTYLVLKPISRWSIVVPKLVAPFIVGGALVAASGAVASLLITGGDPGQAATTVAAVLVGSAAYASAFNWAGLVTRNALAFGIVYVFVWEAFLTDFLGGIRFLSVRQYTLAIVHGLDGERLADAGVELSLGGGLFGAAVVFAVFLVLTVRRLTSMDVP